MPAILIRLLSPFIEKFFDLLYNQFAWGYDLVAWIVSIGNWNTWVKSITEELNGSQTLELGFGTGHLQKALLNEGKQIFGLDRSIHMGKISRTRLRELKLSPNLINGTVQNMPLPNNSIDQIVATFPSEYIADPVTIREVDRVLKPEGQVVILYAANFTKNKSIHQLITWLYTITGQAGEQYDHIQRTILENFKAIGYNLMMKEKSLANSEIHYFIADKG